MATLPDIASVKVDLEKKQAEVTSSQLLKINELQKGVENTNYAIAELRASKTYSIRTTPRPEKIVKS